MSEFPKQPNTAGFPAPPALPPRPTRPPEQAPPAAVAEPPMPPMPAALPPVAERPAPVAPAPPVAEATPSRPALPEPLPNPRAEQGGGKSSRWRRAAVLVGSHAVAIGAGVVIATLTTSPASAEHSPAPRAHTSADASPSPHREAKVPPLDIDAAETPVTLGQKFLSLTVVNPSKAGADESWQYFSDAEKAKTPLATWEKTITKAGPFLEGSAPILRNETEMLAAADSHQPVTADYFDQGTDGNYVVQLDESYDTKAGGWRVDLYAVVPTHETQ